MGALISLVIEVTQGFIPARDSWMVDLICNTGGTVLGAGFLVLVSRWLGGLPASQRLVNPPEADKPLVGWEA